MLAKYTQIVPFLPDIGMFNDANLLTVVCQLLEILSEKLLVRKLVEQIPILFPTTSCIPWLASGPIFLSPDHAI